MTDREPYTRPEAAALLRVSEWTVGAMIRDGILLRVPGPRKVLIVRASLDAVLEGYHAKGGEPDGEASAKAAPSRRRDRMQADGSLAPEAVGRCGALHRPIRAAPGDVVVRVVPSRSRGTAT